MRVQLELSGDLPNQSSLSGSRIARDQDARSCERRYQMSGPGHGGGRGMLGLTCDTGSAEALGSEGIDNVRLDRLEFVFDACEGRIGGGQWSELASART